MKRNELLIVVAVLAIVAGVASYLYYQERQSGVEIKIDDQGITFDGY